MGRVKNTVIGFGFVLVLFPILPPVRCAQGPSPAVPEAAFVSADKYTNAFFGFSMPLPHDPNYHLASISSPGSEHHLFGLAKEKGHTVLDISAEQMNSTFAERLIRSAPVISIHGKQFSKGVSRQNEASGTVWKVMYLTIIDSYLLEFVIYSLDAGTAEELQHCVEATVFFDPAKARALAGPNSRPYTLAPPAGLAQRTPASTSTLIGKRDKGTEDQVARLFGTLRADAKLPPLTRNKRRESLEAVVCTLAQAGSMGNRRSGDQVAFYRTTEPASIPAELSKVASLNKQTAQDRLAYPRYSVAIWRVEDSQKVMYWVGVEHYPSAIEEFVDFHFTDDAFYHNLWKDNVAAQCLGK
jgi:hypothetical protein